MAMAKSGEISNLCQPNAIMTLQEFFNDYASEETKIIGKKVTEGELEFIQREDIKDYTIKSLKKIDEGLRDFNL